MPHEISQSAKQVNWFKAYPYPYIHPDSSLWYLIAMGNYYHFTGDKMFVRESWPNIEKAYRYCLSLMDPRDGLLMIPKGDWGSMELTGFSKDAAMAGEWIAVLRAMRDLNAMMGNSAAARKCAQREKTARASLEREFWNPKLQYYDYGLFRSGKPVTYLNPAIGWSAWLGSLPRSRAKKVLERLSTASFLADWGERNMSLADPRYKEGSYHVGSAWPFATAGPMLAQFKYDDAVQAFLTWRAMLKLTYFDAPGDMPEVLTGVFYRLLDDAVPHQMFSELTVIPGLVNGVLGLDLDVPDHSLKWAPQMPPSWPQVAVRDFPYGKEKLTFAVRQSSSLLVAKIRPSGTERVKVQFSPALPMGSTVVSVDQDGKPLAYHVRNRGSDVRVVVHTHFSASTSIVVHYKPGVALEVDWLPILAGDQSRNLRVLQTSYGNGTVAMTVEGRPGQLYKVRAYTPWSLKVVEGAQGIEKHNGYKVLELIAPTTDQKVDKAGYVRWRVQVKVE